MPPAWKFLSFTQNLGLRGGTAFSHAWSLCIEAQFYLLLPFCLLARRNARRAAWLLPLLIIGAGVVLRAALAKYVSSFEGPSFGLWQQLIYYPTYARLDSLVVGVSLAAVEINRPALWNGLANQAWWIWLPALTAIV